MAISKVAPLSGRIELSDRQAVADIQTIKGPGKAGAFRFAMGGKGFSIFEQRLIKILLGATTD
jgi:hypothetical protein